MIYCWASWCRNVMNVSLKPPPLVPAHSTIAWPVIILKSWTLFDFFTFSFSILAPFNWNQLNEEEKTIKKIVECFWVFVVEGKFISKPKLDLCCLRVNVHWNYLFQAKKRKKWKSFYKSSFFADSSQFQKVQAIHSQPEKKRLNFNENHDNDYRHHHTWY